MSELPDRHAAVIGIDAYGQGHGVAPLSSAVADARAIAEALETGHSYDGVHLRLDADATREGILDLLEETLPHGLGPDSGVLVYYAGHGLAVGEGGSPKGFLVPQDARLDDRDTWLSMDRIRQALGELPCRHLLVVLDCCYAGSFRWATTRGMVPTGRPLYESQYYRYLLGSAWQVLTSASHSEKAIDLVKNNRGEDEEGHSPFAAALLRGLAGAADSWRTGHEADGVMTVTELFQYVFEELVRPVEKWPQTPGLWPLKPDNTGEFIFLSPRQEIKTLPDPPLDDANNPWPGFRTYGESDAPLFFGRERVVEELLERIQNPSRPLLAVTGTSASGKTSVIRAGLLPRLAQPPEAPDEETSAWTIVEVALEAEPLERLEEAARRLAEAPDPKLLFIDAFEELFLAGHDAAVQAGVLGRLRALMTGDDPAPVLLTLRTGFEPRLKEILEDLLAPGPGDVEGPYELPAPTLEELRQIIEQPAMAKALYFEPAELVDELIGEVIGLPGALPLLSYTLAEMYRRAQVRRRDWGSRDRALNREDYGSIGPEGSGGGVAGAVHALADQLLDDPDSADLAVTVRRVTLRMVSFEGWRGASRRRISRRELVYADSEEQKRVEEVLKRLTAAHLVVVARQHLEPSHDALVRDWPRMTKWLEQSTDDQLLLRSVWPAAEEWQEQGRAEERLWAGGPRLAQLREMSAELNRLELEFLGASLDAARVASAREWMSEDPTRAALVLRELVNVETGGAVSAMVEALSQPLAAVVFPDGDFGAFSADGTKILTTSADGTARVWNADGSGPLAILRGHKPWVRGVFSADGTKVLTASDDTTARVWNVDGSGVPVVLRGHEGYVLSAAFNADGTRIVTASADGTARVWNVDGSGLPVVLRGHEDLVWTAVFNAAGTKVLTAGGCTARIWNVDGSGEPVVLRGHAGWVRTAVFNAACTKVLTSSYDGTARIWDATGSGEPVVLEGHEDKVVSAVFDADEMRVLTCSADKTARVWHAYDASGPVVLRGHDDWVVAAHFNADGTRVVTSSYDGTARIWNADGPDGRTPGEPLVLRGHRHVVGNAAFNADGSRVVTSGSFATVRVWSADPGEPVVLRGHEAALVSAAFNAAGTKVVTASDDRTARVWNVDGSGETVILRGHDNRVLSAAFNGDGTRVVTASEDGTARVWNVAGSGQPLELEGHEDRVESAVFDGTGTKVVTASWDGTARVWDASGAGRPVVLRGHGDRLWSAAFNASGNKIVTASLDGTARVWNADGAEKPLVLAHEEMVLSAAFDAAGTRVVTASPDGTARVWSLDASPDGVLGEPVVLRGHDSWVISAAFDAGGTRILTASVDQTARLWNADGSGQPVVFRGHTEELSGAAFNAAGTRVLTVSRDGTARVWNVDGPEGRPPGQPVVLWHSQQIGYLSAAFDAAGTRVVTASWDGTARVWTIDVALLRATLRAVTSACLEPEFRVRYLGESPEAAQERHAECERRHGRQPRRDTAQASSSLELERPPSPMLGRRFGHMADRRHRRREP